MSLFVAADGVERAYAVGDLCRFETLGVALAVRQVRVATEPCAYARQDGLLLRFGLNSEDMADRLEYARPWIDSPVDAGL